MASLMRYLDWFLPRIQLDTVHHDGIRYHVCRTCRQEWRAENLGDPVNPDWWQCPNGCNAEAGRLTPPRGRAAPKRR
jgi:hypothetical protein